MPIFTARTLITAIGAVAYPAITVDAAGLIADLSTDAAIRSESILTSTFLDIHIHGAAGHDVMHASPYELSAMQRFLARHGTAHYLPTTVTASVDATLRSLETLAAAIERPTPANEATPIGIHLEGPFLSHAKRGVHPSDLLQPPSTELFDRLQQAGRGHVRLLTLASELPGAIDLIRHAAQSGVRVSLGHTNASAAEAEAALAAGAASATHTFNAMRPLDHREPGVLGTVLDTPSLYSELICDGIHVAPALVRLWLRLKQDHAILVTDGISATGMPDGQYQLGPLAVTVRDRRCTLTDSPETLAGSVLTLDQAVANLQNFTGCSSRPPSAAPAATPPRCSASAKPSAASAWASLPASTSTPPPAAWKPPGSAASASPRKQDGPLRA